MQNDRCKELEIVEIAHHDPSVFLWGRSQESRLRSAMFSDQDASQTGAKPAGLRIRLFGLASVWMAAISSSHSLKSKTAKFRLCARGWWFATGDEFLPLD